MLELKNIVKEYYTEDETVRALNGVSLKFRKSEFVSILGPSGCGKTTLLNIVGGLDRYTDGDLVINGKSTKDYTDKEWDTYRNHSVGFVFQSYNLIPHQTVLENVELALTLSGIGKEERRKRAKAVLEKVGLGNKLKSKPNQLSGGQMQRVAIARALINDPEILLADEPTGALDSKTSEQIMELLKEISNDRLIVMVTHNPEIAEAYSTRIIRMLDGEIVEDPNPVTEQEEILERQILSNEKRTNKGKSKTSMSFFTALSLSLKNLLTKKTRTLLVSFAGSIGIIGIALILSLSAGFQAYINRVQEETLSNYPLTVQAKTSNYESLLEGITGGNDDGKVEYPTDGKISADQTFTELLDAVAGSSVTNDLKTFKEYLDSYNYDKEKITAIQYVYNIDFTMFKDGEEMISTTKKFVELFSSMQGGDSNSMMDMSALETMFGSKSEAINSPELLKSQYELVGSNSRWPSFNDPSEVIIVLDKYNQIPDYILPELGLIHVDEILFPAMVDLVMTSSEFPLTEEMAQALVLQMFAGKLTNPEQTERSFNANDLVGTTYNIALPYQGYELDSNGIAQKVTLTGSREIKIVGVVRPKEGSAGGALSSGLVYTKALTDAIISDMEQSAVINAQLANPEIDVTTGNPFTDPINGYNKNMDDLFGYVNRENPSAISFYVASFEDRDYILQIIDEYNAGKPEEQQIEASDFLGSMMAGVTDIINAISYVLIGFVSVSLIVSSIMIGIITYISVLERIKEIGILRALGASKRDVSRVFNAETLIIGLAAGLLGIGVTVLLNIPISFIIYKLAGIKGVAKLPWLGGVILVVISMGLTLLAGLIPSKIASKKDPVVALRTE